MNVLMALKWLEKHLPHWTVEMLGALVIAPSVVIPWLLLLASVTVPIAVIVRRRVSPAVWAFVAIDITTAVAVASAAIAKSMWDPAHPPRGPSGVALAHYELVVVSFWWVGPIALLINAVTTSRAGRVNGFRLAHAAITLSCLRVMLFFVLVAASSPFGYPLPVVWTLLEQAPAAPLEADGISILLQLPFIVIATVVLMRSAWIHLSTANRPRNHRRP